MGNYSIGVSACLIGENCKYNGGNNYNADLAKWLKQQTVIPVCPEVLGGLSIPRTPAEIVNGVVTDADGRNVHEAFVNGAEQAFAILKEAQADLVILQSRSPSCGVKERYDGSFSGKRIKDRGIFADFAIKNGLHVIDLDDFEQVKNCISRVERIEQLYHEISSASPELRQEKLRILEQYYESEDWLHDHDLDQNRMLPKSMARGVLTEDLIYDLLCEAAED